MIRTFKKTIQTIPTTEGAGVRLKRGFGFGDTKEHDPFLLFDDFSGEHEEDYVAGFPGHPHRGMETVTYILEGEVEHRDSLGNHGVIGPGDMQWMSAGSGIIHEEMPHTKDREGIKGFQLWVNLPKAQKMSAPQYRDVASVSIPVVETEGVSIRVLCGSYQGVAGAVENVTHPITYLDVTLLSQTKFSHSVSYEDTLFVYVLEGGVVCRAEENRTEQWVKKGELAFTHKGNTLTLTSSKAGARFLLIAGTPLNEPVAWRGPIVMNTEEEIRTAFEELQNGTFVKHV